MYSDSEREIFSYTKWTAGERKEVKADPAALQRKLLRASGSESLGDLLKQMELEYPENPQEHDIRATDELVFKATEKVLGIACTTFGMKTLDETGEGDLERDIVATLASFLGYLSDSKKKAESSLTCSAPTEPASSVTPAGSTTAIGSRSASIAIASPVNVPPK